LRVSPKKNFFVVLNCSATFSMRLFRVVRLQRNFLDSNRVFLPLGVVHGALADSRIADCRNVEIQIEDMKTWTSPNDLT
jgi:hypothetical protein